MSRTLYFTGIHLLERSHVTLERIDVGNQITVSGTIHEVPRGLPPDCEVVLEAFDHVYLHRFKLGLAYGLTKFGPIAIEGLTLDARPRFRVKFVGRDEDGGRIILAVRENIRPEGEDGPSDSLLPILAKSGEALGGELWAVKSASGSYEPQLWLSKEAGLFHEVENGAKHTIGLILPAAIRIILSELFLREDQDAEGDIKEKWMEFGRRACGRAAPEASADRSEALEELQEWIDDVLAAFCKEQKWAEAYAEFRGQGAEAEVQE